LHSHSLSNWRKFIPASAGYSDTCSETVYPLPKKAMFVPYCKSKEYPLRNLFRHSIAIGCLVVVLGSIPMVSLADSMQVLLEETSQDWQKDPYKVLPKVAEGIRLSEQSGSTETKIEFYLNGVRIANQLRDFELGARFIQQAMGASQDLKDASIVGDIKRTEGELHKTRLDWESAETVLKDAKATFKRAKMPGKLILANLDLAIVSAHLGDIKQANVYAQESLTQSTSLDDLDLIAKSYETIGLIPLITHKTTFGNLELAVEYLISLDPITPLSKMHPPEKFARPLEALESAISSYRQAENQKGIARCQQLKGDIMVAMGRLDQAVTYYEDAIQAYREQQFPTTLAVSLAHSLHLRGDHAEAIPTLRQYTAASSIPDIPWFKLFESYLHREVNDTENALVSIEEGLDAIARSNNARQYKILYAFKSKLARDNEDFKTALESLELANRYEAIDRDQFQAGKPMGVKQATNLVTDEEQRFQKNRTYFLESKLYDLQLFVNIAWMIGLAFALVCFFVFLLKRDSEKKLNKELETAHELEHSLEDELDRTRIDKEAVFKDIAQELRTPMSGIVGTVPIFRDTSLSKLQENCVNIVDISSRSILTLINDISDFSNLEDGKVVLAEDEMDLVLLTETVAQLFDTDSSYIDVKLICEVPSDPIPMLRGDANRIQQILLTLVSRAFQTTRGDHVNLRLEKLVPKSARDFRIRIVVEDSKSIADLEKLHEIFNPIPTLTDATSIHRPASMMGMAIVKKLVDAMHGSIEVTANESDGVKVVVMLPFILEPNQDAWETPNPFERFPRKRVLVVDQNRHSRAALCNHLRTWGLDIEMIETFDDAIQFLEAKMNFDLISLDTTDSGSSLTNLEKVSAIRSCESGKDTPIILVSHFLELNQPSEMKRQRNVHYLAAPIQVRQLHSIVRQAILHKTSSNQSFAKLTPAQSIPEKEEPAVDPEKGFQFIPYILPFRTEQKINPSLRILLAEDNVVNQRVTTLLLKKIGFVIDIVPNGREAVDRVAENCYDVVLMDKVMPILDGLGATREIRELEGIEQPIIIALTASASMDDEIACRKATMDNFLAKPVQLEKMKAALAFASAVLERRENINS
jgi:CheY-like chemotaxis protein